MSKTKIEWCDEVWNPTTGCTKLSEGCVNCYAERMSSRLRGRCGYRGDHPFLPAEWPDRLEIPFKWKKPRRIFVNSMGDLFHGFISNKFIADVFGIMHSLERHTFLILTKRPKSMKSWFEWMTDGTMMNPASFFKNVWIGVSVENQEMAEQRIPPLLQIPAAKRFVSCEPLLGPVSLHAIHDAIWRDTNEDDYYDSLRGDLFWDDGEEGIGGGPKLDWVICGAETGPRKRPMNLDWARNLRDQCKTSGTPFFFKKDSAGERYIDGETFEEFPI